MDLTVKTLLKRQKRKKKLVNIIGGGLAGCEATYQLAKRGVKVRLFEQKPIKFSPAHSNKNLAEIVCSNSLKSTDLATASGLLKAELELLDCLLLKIAKQVSVPAGSALAIDREIFSQRVNDYISNMPNVEIVYGEVENIDFTEPTIIATGPLTSDRFAQSIKDLLGADSSLSFFDASAPIINADTLDLDKTFTAGRYGKGESDYINCPMNKEEYYNFIHELANAKRVELKEFENVNVFEGCMPIEIMASRGEDTLRFGPLRPVGLVDGNGVRPFAIVQLRKESNTNNLYNLVGFQTNLLFPEQKRVFSLIPALANAEFVKYGVMHRNSYICAPKYLTENFKLKQKNNIWFAGQISGVEGYVESIVSGLVSALSVFNQLKGNPQIQWSNKTLIGALTAYISTANDNNFQPMNANFGILPPHDETIKDKKERKIAYTTRALECMKQTIKQYNI